MVILVVFYWERLLILVVSVWEMIGLGYFGIDMVLDKEEGFMVLEFNVCFGFVI